MQDKIKEKNINSKASAKRSAFLKYYLSEKIEGKVNPCFGNGSKAAKKVGYSDTYAEQILSRITKQNNPAGELLGKVRKDLGKALQEQGITPDWIASRVYQLGNKTDKRIINKKLVDTGDPDSQSVKAALDFVARTQNMYEPDQHIHKFDGYTKQDLINHILAKIRK